MLSWLVRLIGALGDFDFTPTVSLDTLILMITVRSLVSSESNFVNITL